MVDQELRDAFEKHGILNTNLVMAANLFGSDAERGHRWLGRDRNGNDRGREPVSWSDDPLLTKVWEAYGRLHKLVKQFDREVWLAGFGRDYMDLPERGYEAPFGDTTIMLYCMAGRVMLTFNIDGGNSQFTLLTDDAVSEARMGTQSFMCTEEEMTRTLTDAIEAYKEGGLGITHNADIRIAGT
jgi:hypothetical protein